MSQRDPLLPMAAIIVLLVSQDSPHPLCLVILQLLPILRLRKNATHYEVWPIIYKYFQRHNLGEANKENIIRFINANKDYLNCAGESRGNFIKVAIAKIHYSEVIKGYLFPISKRNNANVEVDFNAVEMVNGKPETIVDFIDALIADEVEGYSFSNQTKDELKRLRRVLVDEQRGFAAKRFAELPKEIQDQYLSGTILATRK